jgi:hypothetical protein
LPQRKIKSTSRHRNGLAAKFGDTARIILEHSRPEGSLIPGIGDGLANLGSLSLCDFLDLFPQTMGDLK